MWGRDSLWNPFYSPKTSWIWRKSFHFWRPDRSILFFKVLYDLERPPWLFCGDKRNWSCDSQVSLERALSFPRTFSLFFSFFSFLFLKFPFFLFSKQRDPVLWNPSWNVAQLSLPDPLSFPIWNHWDSRHHPLRPSWMQRVSILSIFDCFFFFFKK